MNSLLKIFNVGILRLHSLFLINVGIHIFGKIFVMSPPVGVDPGAELEQDSGHGAVTRAGRLPVNKPQINVEQQLVSVDSHEGSVPVLIVVLHVGPGLQQHAHHLLVAAGTRVPGVQILFSVENIFTSKASA